jgi:AAA+ ATPase superfamily predicted ATPase
MPIEYDWPLRSEFYDRAAELAAMEQWRVGRDRKPLNLYGRRRVGKSWLFRAFAHGKPAILLVAEKVTEGAQLSRFAERLESALGIRPELPDVASLIRTLYRLGRDGELLAVIDEFPYLLPSSDRGREETLTAVQAVWEEERDASKTKLVLCGSHVAQMERLMAEGSALRGRVTPLSVSPFSFSEARPFFQSTDPIDEIARYAVAGGMPLYLDELGRGGTLRELVCRRVLDSRGPLFDDPRRILEQELRQPHTYFSILESLASGAKALDQLGSELRTSGHSLTAYLRTLREMRIVERVVPITDSPDAQGGRYRLSDGFFRFWFRFVFRFQDDLTAGLRAHDLYTAELEPALADHIAPAFEDICRVWVRSNLGAHAPRVGQWWGAALHSLRKTGERRSEEIDIVGTAQGRVTVVGECKWTNKALSVSILNDLERYKLPALSQRGARLAKGGPITVLFSRSGFTDGLKEAAERDEKLRLVELDELVSPEG